MSAQPFQVRIACIIPRSYDTVVGGANNDNRVPWNIENPSEFCRAVDHQMELLAQKWDERSGSRITIRWKPWWYSEVVREMRRHGGRHEIDDASFRSLRERCTSEGAMYQFVWVVVPQPIADQVSTESHYFHRVVWLPCREADTIKKSRCNCFRSGVDDEFRHCLKNALCQGGVNAAKNLKVHASEKFVAGISSLLTPKVIQVLLDHFGYCRDWEM